MLHVVIMCLVQLTSVGEMLYGNNFRSVVLLMYEFRLSFSRSRIPSMNFRVSHFSSSIILAGKSCAPNRIFKPETRTRSLIRFFRPSMRIASHAKIVGIVYRLPNGRLSVGTIMSYVTSRKNQHHFRHSRCCRNAQVWYIF